MFTIVYLAGSALSAKLQMAHIAISNTVALANNEIANVIYARPGIPPKRCGVARRGLVAINRIGGEALGAESWVKPLMVTLIAVLLAGGFLIPKFRRWLLGTVGGYAVLALFAGTIVAIIVSMADVPSC